MEVEIHETCKPSPTGSCPDGMRATCTLAPNQGVLCALMLPALHRRSRRRKKLCCRHTVVIPPSAIGIVLESTGTLRQIRLLHPCLWCQAFVHVACLYCSNFSLLILRRLDLRVASASMVSIFLPPTPIVLST